MLTIPDLLAIGVGSTIGAGIVVKFLVVSGVSSHPPSPLPGIFVLTGQVAKNVTGPAVVLSYLASGIACVFSGLCYAEFASRIPVAGSAYLYAYCTLGEFIAWFIGWDLVLEVVLLLPLSSLWLPFLFTHHIPSLSVVCPGCGSRGARVVRVSGIPLCRVWGHHPAGAVSHPL